MNIEELFPQHAWKKFSQESAAAAYHTLAALFLRFGDAEAAVQSLQCSERLEESPRFFALLGLIQQSQGETLGAVANFVSSLQYYEARKKDDGRHYLSFKPENLEIINSRLVDGLNALNQRDNDRALTHFSEAVFNFDPFYAEYGVQSLQKGR
jgi:tetratricopeptide (TPR) repeat protein